MGIVANLAGAVVMAAAIMVQGAGAEGAGRSWDVMPYIDSLSDECIDSAIDGDTPEMMLVICEDVLAGLEILESDIADWAPASAEMNHLLLALAITLDAVGEAHGLMIHDALSQTRCEYMEQGFIRMAQIRPELSTPDNAEFYGIIYRGFEDKARMCRRRWKAPDGAIGISED